MIDHSGSSYNGLLARKSAGGIAVSFDWFTFYRHRSNDPTGGDGKGEIKIKEDLAMAGLICPGTIFTYVNLDGGQWGPETKKNHHRISDWFSFSPILRFYFSHK